MENTEEKIAYHLHSETIEFVLFATCGILNSGMTRIYTLLSAIISLPMAVGAPIARRNYPSLATSNPSYANFISTPSNDTTVKADIAHFGGPGLGFNAWSHRATIIRSSGTAAMCTGNLSVALGDVGAAYQASSSGSTTLLTLLPTAGALVGAPAKELWVLWNLVPVAGFFSLALSLGGNIAPHQVSDYANLEDFSYSDMRSTSAEKLNPRRESNLSSKAENDETEADVVRAAEQFANHVHARAMDPQGSDKTLKILLGIFSLCVWISLIVVACHLLQAGAIIVWWCTAVNWTFCWYAVTIAASILEFIANNPLARSWTIRVSRAPQLRISPDAPSVIPVNESSNQASQQSALLSDWRKHKPDVIDGLNEGYNTVGQVIMDPNAPWSASKDPFYVMISCGGVRKYQTMLRLFSKLFSVGTFTFSTALFASSSLVQITIATVVMTLILGAGVLGRVTAMWISAIIMRDKPVLHRIVKNKKDASVFMEAVLRQEGLVCEVLGHVVVNGMCVKRRSKYTWDRILGVLAPPFDLTKIAVPPSP
ncbi:hypothetical protein BDV96DRAFT_535432 [Lophiotrema nucula]|uniref:Uncharacterized protein n=1 Tax=Lophiotrema nucula TaxID=690887 RepID=A0A6A5YGA1_9PLEO|nr:hypothetical protein BDV96DRAFT_535432 [Lophiotrema nucula]